MKILTDQLIKVEKPEQTPVALRSGQILSGTIKRYFPNETAEVQIGKQSFIARISIPLSVGESYWLQVQKEDGLVQLKVLETIVHGKQAIASAESLLHQLNIPVTKENISLVQFFLKEQLPLSKEVLERSLEWVKSSPSIETSQKAMQMMIERNWPFKAEVFQAVLSIISEGPITPQLNKLQLELKNYQGLQSARELSYRLQQLTEADSLQLINKLVQAWVKNSSPQSLAAFSMLKNIGIHSGTGNEGEALAKTLEKLFNGERTSLPISKVLSEVLTNNQTGNKPAFILSLAKLDTVLRQMGLSHQHLDVQHLINEVRTKENQFPVSEQRIIAILKDALSPYITKQGNDSNLISSMIINSERSPAFVMEQVKNLMDHPALIHPKMQSNQERLLLSSLRGEMSLELQSIETPQIKDLLKMAIKTLGLSHEQHLIQYLQSDDNQDAFKQDMLKPLLLRLLAEELPIGIKDTAKELLNKLTGFQLLSQEVGPIQQYAYQIPLPFLKKSTDLSIQWSGKKTSNGEIDPDHCRILFYLNLQSLDETIVDLLIQKRVMNITVINKHDWIDRAARPFIDQLKHNLEAQDYMVSSIRFIKEQKVIKPARSTLNITKPFNGVDIRV
ncbi:hypothetical protein [Cytobacillus purgationiresistens]|uniref:Flagellar hook-length control protein FliK n=1 Tax=Cytobacillus purgationiresistens TaxID=863449 RepID=A0ABU0AHH3_9BACI|nr:hypothetical protein [Cytobacillus purgationiresistens]MDQ0270247.1 hypothetical protein [Cytobacillus purgationiresistens]